MKPKHGVAILFVVGKIFWPASWASWWWLVPILFGVEFCLCLAVAAVAAAWLCEVVMEAE